MLDVDIPVSWVYTWRMKKLIVTLTDLGHARMKALAMAKDLGMSALVRDGIRALDEMGVDEGLLEPLQDPRALDVDLSFVEKKKRGL